MALNIRELDRWQDRGVALKELDAWLEGGLKLEKATGLSSHDLWENGAINMLAGPFRNALIDLPKEKPQFFVVQHDWAAAFKGAEDFEGGDFRTPFEHNCFEFRISGKRVCATVTDFEDRPKHIMTFVRTAHHWVMPVLPYGMEDGEFKPLAHDADNRFGELPLIMAKQIRAICISLEAGVAEFETVERPEKVNKARERRGKEPLPNYNVVYLGRGHHRGEHGEGRAPKRRLHFRRGHWRHLNEERKTWVRWCLVGDPDLGFIEKEYRL